MVERALTGVNRMRRDGERRAGSDECRDARLTAASQVVDYLRVRGAVVRPGARRERRVFRGIGMGRVTAVIVLLISLPMLGGCATSGSRAAERYGKTFYLDGAGNWGFGAAEVPGGLREAGYKGNVEIYIWTTSLIPLIDQLNIPAARLRAAALADRIKSYRRRFPENKLNIIALSAGTGVATWAVESLDRDTKINNLVLLASSLSHGYDMTKALKCMTGKIYVYHSPHDEVLAAVPLIGTIDGKRGVQSVGQVGLKTPAGFAGRIVNTPWSRKYVRFGWTGSHTDCTRKPFIRHVISKHVIDREPRFPGRRAGGGQRSLNSPRTAHLIAAAR